MDQLREALRLPGFQYTHEVMIEGVRFAQELNRIAKVWEYIANEKCSGEYSLAMLRPDQPECQKIRNADGLREMLNDQVRTHVDMLIRKYDVDILVKNVVDGVPLEDLLA